jgi:hypothetical protein
MKEKIHVHVADDHKILNIINLNTNPPNYENP